MKNVTLYFLCTLSIVIISCGKQTFSTNGETIYRTGRNIKGEKMLDKKASRIKLVNSCVTCHGKKGHRMADVSIAFNDLSNPLKYGTPYTDSSFFRFLDHDLKSDGTRADIGVIWKMKDTDKYDLLQYLKSL